MELIKTKIFEMRYFSALLMLFVNLTGCSILLYEHSATPDPKISEGMVFPERIPLKVAIKFISNTHSDSVPISLHPLRKDKHILSIADVKVLSATKKLFTEIFTRIFSDVRVLEENPNINDIFDLKINVRTVSKKSDWRAVKSDKERISAYIKYEVSILSGKEEIANFTVEDRKSISLYGKKYSLSIDNFISTRNELTNLKELTNLEERIGSYDFDKKVYEAYSNTHTKAHLNRTYLNDNVKDAFESAMNRAGEEFLDKFKRFMDTENNPISKLVEQNELPADLVFGEINFSDESSKFPNQAIDVRQPSTLTIPIHNNGQGKAFDTRLDISLGNNIPIEIIGDRAFGSIRPGEEKKIRLQIQGGLDLMDGIAKLTIRAKEKRGYDSKEILFKIPTRALRPPEIVITGYKIKDGNAGFASGNDNRIPENGETVELIPILKNHGIGPAIDVELAITEINDGLDVKERSLTIPWILPGQSALRTLVFSIPRTHSGKRIDIGLTATDSRKDVFHTRKTLSLDMQTRRPILSYTHKITDHGNGHLENGDEGDIEIRLTNNGNLDAHSVVIELDAKGISLPKSHVELDRIAAGFKVAPQIFPFHIPRTFDRKGAKLGIRIRQADFPEIVDVIPLPIRQIRPDFEIIHNIITDGGNIVEQGKPLEIPVKVKNIGQLDAKDVSLEIQTDADNFLQKGVRLNATSERRIRIGSIPAKRESNPRRFIIDVQRRAEVGELPIRFRITQKDFPTQKRLVAVKIRASQPEERTVVRGDTARQYTNNMPPIINVVLPKNRRVTTGNSFVNFKSFVDDDRGIYKVILTVNGKEIKDLQPDETDPKKRIIETRIPLRGGENKIQIIAYDIDKNPNEVIIYVTRKTNDAIYGKRVALVIGNSKYSSNSLRNPKNDAEDMERVLKEIGFKVALGIDLNRQEMEKYIERFRKNMLDGDAGLFFYAGHANQYNGINYLLPVEFNVNTLEDKDDNEI